MAERVVTKFGTPCSTRWCGEWVRRVEEAEEKLGRRVCGAVTWDGGPCLLGAAHGSGRCRYHGGHAGTGAPAGSANARVHGLYARRLQRCGSHCALWGSCPFAGADVLALPPSARPVCAYEREEYRELVKFYFKAEDDLTTEGTENTEGEEESEIANKRDSEVGGRPETGAAGDIGSDGSVGNRVSGSGVEGEGSVGAIGYGAERGVKGGDVLDDSCEDDRDVDAALGLRFPGLGEECAEPFLVHQLVLLTVMQTRAAAVLSEMTLTTTVEVDSPNYKMKTVKPAAALEAFIRIAREYRALRATIDTKKLMPKAASMGLGSRLRSLMLRTRKAVEESIVDLDAADAGEKTKSLTTEDTESTERVEDEFAVENFENAKNSTADHTDRTDRKENTEGLGEEFAIENAENAKKLTTENTESTKSAKKAKEEFAAENAMNTESEVARERVGEIANEDEDVRCERDPASNRSP